MKHRGLILAALALVAAAGGFYVYARPTLENPVGPVPREGFEALRAQASYVTSQGCVSCHAERTESWQRTYHSTMTQAVPGGEVRGRFEGQPLTWLGVTSVPKRTADGGYVIETTHPTREGRQEFPIVRMVGSRRMQQYVTRLGDRHVRLPVAFSIAEDRWFHLSEAFFHPDGEAFHANTAVWDLNCIFCHNVKANPGREAEVRVAPELGPEGRLNSSVAELGIACEACHGPGEEHAERMRSPLRRWGFAQAGNSLNDPTIVNPAELHGLRSVQVCGHCHGQRVPKHEDDIVQILAKGDPFTAGEDLARYYRPIGPESSIGALSLAPRFWGDGSPRLTAYEFQGVLESACFSRGEMTCLSCHAMHEGDPHGQLRPDRLGNAMCTQCHGELAEPAALTAHTFHQGGSLGSQCVSCHMPPVVYGVMSWHPSHQIESPDPRRAEAVRMPDACTTCHTGRSRAWAAEARERWWPAQAAEALAEQVPEKVPGDSEEALSELPREPEMVRALFHGDVVYRTLAAYRLGQPSPEPEIRDLAVRALAELLADPYPNVRRTVHNSLTALTLHGDIPYAHDPAQLRRQSRDFLTAQPIDPLPPASWFWPLGPDGRLDPETLRRWISTRVEVPVSIGE